MVAVRASRRESVGGERLYAVRRFSPPQEDLGSVALAVDVQNGDSVELLEKARAGRPGEGWR